MTSSGVHLPHLWSALDVYELEMTREVFYPLPEIPPSEIPPYFRGRSQSFGSQRGRGSDCLWSPQLQRVTYPQLQCERKPLETHLLPSQLLRAHPGGIGLFMNLGPCQEGWLGWGFSHSGEGAPDCKDVGQREEMNREWELGMEGSVSAPTPRLLLLAPFSASAPHLLAQEPSASPFGPSPHPTPGYCTYRASRFPTDLSRSSIFITSRSHITHAWK